eukprot:Protomagalhaensia_sp_Gyna_25__2644@NODE_2506_length_1047_cov_171_826389_g2076_i0_p2_GENE_NODE_2506_length_1047_cov_171_826389_g2076_i0NODE_2506_length_1047_cov_171_826389_g2076_i0_p2_ORF_typecomplete_len115_score2_82Srg/PF02118_21/0_0071SUR7/PF06687_12/0_01Ribosomal_L18/PF17135_4/0_0647tm_1/PF00001_21/0_1DUF1218/PF06749_12/1_4e03DUF1218/PF06749_12/0_1Cytomega_UL20A/PF05984_12/0_22PEMT/PF04191_13/4_8_NODE_2506_length_1047_cov_171_826389_g2076_i0576920
MVLQTISALAFILIGCSLTAYFLVARTAFLMVNSQGYYPVPEPHLCWYLSMSMCFVGLTWILSTLVAALCVLIATISQGMRLRQRNKEKKFTDEIVRSTLMSKTNRCSVGMSHK